MSHSAAGEEVGVEEPARDIVPSQVLKLHRDRVERIEAQELHLSRAARQAVLE